MRRPRREELLAIIVAPIIVLSAIVGWMRRDAIADCCTSKPALQLNAPLPTNEKLRTGQLSNHLRYFVLHNESPETRAELRLVVNAGAVLEADDQRGLAHAVEHMVFRGTKRFPRHAVDDYLQSIGMRGGSDINAWTSEDETVYRFTVPTDRAGVLDTSLAILADMAQSATFDSTEAQQEAGVVMAEWRSGTGAVERLRNERNDLLFAGSKYAGHPVIGDTTVLRRFDVGAMRRYYADWYRPDLMAVVAVGDFEPADIELLIRKHFKGLTMPRAPRERPTETISRSRPTRAAVLSDPEATGSWITVWNPRRETPVRTMADYRSGLIDQLWLDLLSDRLDDATEFPGSPVATTSVSTRSLVRPLEADVVGVLAMEQQELPALDLLSREIARLSTFPVNDEEIQRRTAMMLRRRRNAEEWSDHSSTLANGLADQYLTGDVLITRTSALQLARDLLPTITPADILARGRAASIDSGALLVLTKPTGVATTNTPASLVARAQTASQHAEKPAIDSATTIALISTAPAPGRIASERVVSDASAFDWTLGNGMRVILKPTRFNYDDIEFRMLGPGGASLASDADFPSAYFADGVIRSTGVGPLNGRLLQRRLDPTSLDFTASVRDDAVEMTGSLAPRDLDLLFQLLYLHFTAPRSDSAAFRRYRERALRYARGRTSDPDEIFGDSVAVVTQQNHGWALRNDPRFTGAVDLGRSIDFWKARTANASGFTLIMTGDFTLDRVRPLVAKYLASLPAGKPESPRGSGAQMPKGVMHRRFTGGVGPKARTEILLSGPYDRTPESSDRLNLVQDLVEHALTSRLRERLGGTYGVSAHLGISLVPPSRYTLSIEFETSPEQIDALTSAALEEMERLHTQGPTAQEADKVRAAMSRDLDGEIERNVYWANELSWHALMAWPLGTITQHQADAKLLSQSALRDACAAYLSTAQYVQVTMVPKSKQ